MSGLIECVPNFSEGRRLDVVDAIYDAIASADRVLMLDRSSDADHHRSVITFAGAGEAVLEGAFRGIETAARLIDLTQHRGAHPRIGAADVVPFVPLMGATLDECAALARRLGERVGREPGLPVYLYEAAAMRPERRNLADVRRGGYEALQEAIAHDPARAPDYGPAVMGTAGAVAIGARKALVAYNVYLNTDRVEIAQAIALAVRASGGGLRSVKALGLLVNGRAQVSMNLVDTDDTPIHRVVEMIRREAARWGVMIERSELIGLVSRAALLEAAAWYLQLDSFDESRVLETRIEQAQAGREGSEEAD